MVIIGIKHFHNVLRKIFLFYRLLVIPLVKRIQPETFYRLSIPDT